MLQKLFIFSDTPSWMSKSNSHSNLVALEPEDLKAEGEDVGTDSSSSDEEAENLLQGCIKQAWAAKNNNSHIHKGHSHQKVSALQLFYRVKHVKKVKM